MFCESLKIKDSCFYSIIVSTVLLVITGKSLLVVEVTVPVVLILISVLAVVITFITAYFVYKKYNKKREIRFRRMAFDEVHDDD